MTIDYEAIDESERLEAGVLAALVEKLTPFDPVDVLAAIGGLQLLPENADHLARLEAFAHAVAALGDEAGQHLISRNRLRQLANTEPLGGEGIAAQEDPCDNALTEAFTYHGGTYIVFPGQVDEATFQLRHLAAAVFANPNAYPTEDFVIRADRLLLAALALSTEIARRAGLGRGVLPTFLGRETDVVVPESELLAQLKQAVSFHRDELDQLLTEQQLSLTDLHRLIRPIGSVSIANYQLDQGDLQPCPIVQAGQHYIVALPGMLLAAARHALICLALEYDVQDELAQQYHADVWRSVVQSLGYLGNPLLGPLETETPASRGWQHAFFHLDTDKILCVLLITDTLKGYPSDWVFGRWQVEQEKGDIAAYIRLVEERLSKWSSPPREVFFLVLVQPAGRTLFWNHQGLDAQASSLRLVLTAGDLETLAFLESDEPLALWKFAYHSWNIRQHAHVWASGELNEFDLYRKYGYSYYISDQERPGIIHVLPGGAGELRQEVLRQYDQHATRPYEPEYVTDVVTAYGTREIPLYVPLRLHDLHCVSRSNCSPTTPFHFASFFPGEIREKRQMGLTRPSLTTSRPILPTMSSCSHSLPESVRSLIRRITVESEHSCRRSLKDWECSFPRHSRECSPPSPLCG